MSTIVSRTLSIPSSTLLFGVLGIAMLTSSIVFSEPAPVDVFMAGFIAAMIMLRGGRPGAVTIFNIVCWMPILAIAFVATTLAPDFGAAVKHQVVTLFLFLGAVAIAAFVVEDPEPRAKFVLNCYVVGAVIACLLAYIGYFKMVPGAYELFTNYGRARGSFKDPNVFGAAIAPAIVYVCWLLMRPPASWSWLAVAVCVFMVPALVISFSRGAWISLAVSLAVLGFIALTRSRRRSDHLRLAVLVFAGAAAVVVLISAVLQIPKVSDLMQQRASLSQGYDEGPEGRFGGQVKAVRLILENPILGIGTHCFRTVHHHEEAHNVYLTMALNGGWLGGLLFAASVLLTFAIGLAGAMKIGALQGLFAVVAASLAGMIVEGLVIDLDHWRHFFIVLGLMWGLSDGQMRPVHAPRRSSDPETVYVRRRKIA